MEGILFSVSQGWLIIMLGIAIDLAVVIRMHYLWKPEGSNGVMSGVSPVWVKLKHNAKTLLLLLLLQLDNLIDSSLKQLAKTKET